MQNPLTITLAIAAGLILSQGLAQFSGYTSVNMTAVNSFLRVQLDSAAVRTAQQNLERVNQRNNASHSAQAAARVRAQTAPQTAFRPGAQRLLVRQFAQSLSNKPGEVQELVTAFNEGFKAFEAEARRLGRPHNVAMAFTYLVGVCYLVHYGQEPSETALMNLQANTDAAFGGSEAFKRLTDPERQRVYEALVLMATLPLLGYTVAVEQNDPELLETYRGIAGVALETALGVRPDRLKFTATGLELR
ncbi:DUF6683 family protein [uncultured Meiothermus sp.]|jgi:hypothetical protein|uniref:DUF6683 family protein n=1 Tax=uncultured Meiothermus sp. TaxID=157471 RepID=UPI0026314713|nr:DUF6683 family protein [uncultured Meiothermus sp.]